MNYVALIIDYYLQSREVGISKDNAIEITKGITNHLYDTFKDIDFEKEEFERAMDLVERLGRI